MVGKVRRLLESYEFNVTHKVNVSGSGDAGDTIFICNPNGLHRGDVTDYGKIVEVTDAGVKVSIPFAEDVNKLSVDVYDYVSDEWLEDTLEQQVKPIVSLYAPLKEETVTEYHNGAFRDTLTLDHRDIVEIVGSSGCRIDSVEKETGILKGFFPNGYKNIKITYKYGGVISGDVERACVLLLASFALGFIGGATGGGSISVQGYGRNYGGRGKYHDTRQEFERNAYALLQRHVTGMVGS